MLSRGLRPQTRRLHATLVRGHLIGPSDPVSNLRPVIYDDAVPELRTDVTHPYSLREFAGDTQEYQWKMQRQQLDAYNHLFWTDSNLRFAAAKRAFLDSLPESYAAEDREFALSGFYRRWAEQETVRQSAYSAEWRRRNWASVLLGARLAYERVMARVEHPFGSGKPDREE
ncbi:uncharacterized protein B0H18DRAFT_869642 [Fomitopsis serialis]|uniref:uncharacterized protein n=1 Tax=Fomitopsis serialis TaxID=139415 RepID=UPI002007583E|nr:uncharacterized protein B0H18DRAFT_869642 [Neoantrodia serialis]KAH9934993.1 hypothetical protein B0H18DRAFT_869642 [Neoantrodia serialis]